MFVHVCVVKSQWFLSTNLIDQYTTFVCGIQVFLLACGEQVRGSGHEASQERESEAGGIAESCMRHSEYAYMILSGVVTVHLTPTNSNAVSRQHVKKRSSSSPSTWSVKRRAHCLIAEERVRSEALVRCRGLVGAKRAFRSKEGAPDTDMHMQCRGRDLTMHSMK